MSPEQAGELVGYLTAAFPRDAIENETFAVFTADLSLLTDYDVAYEAARELARGQDRFPTMRELREAYHSVLRRRGTERAQKRGLEQAKPGPPPEWAKVWWWLRHVRDDRDERYLPQMVDPETGLPFGSNEYMTEPEYEAYAAEWRAAGAPKIGLVSRIVGSMVQD